jgi:hypothetical protein
LLRLRCRSSQRYFTLCGLALYGLVATLALSVVKARVGLAQATTGLACADLVTEPRDRFRYMARGERCEGLYIRKNGGGTRLTLLSLTERGPQSGQGTPNSMQLSWPSHMPNGATLQQLNIRAAADTGGRHYRMDVVQPFSTGSYQWPLDVLKGVKIPESKIHLVGFARTKVGSESSQLVFAPLRRGSPQGSATAYDFTLQASADVNEMKYAIRTLGASGWSAGTAPKAAAFGVGAAKRPFTITIPLTEFGSSAAVHRVDFSAKLGDWSDPDPANCVVVFFND